MPAKSNDVTVRAFAELIGLTTKRVHQFIQDGMPHRSRPNGMTVVPREALAWIRDRDRENARADVVPGEAHERVGKLRAERELKEHDLLERRRAVVPLEDLTRFSEELAGGFASVAAGQLQRFERDIVRAATPTDARALTRRIHAALMEGARAYAAQLEAEAAALEAVVSSSSPDPAAA